MRMRWKSISTANRKVSPASSLASRKGSSSIRRRSSTAAAEPSDEYQSLSRHPPAQVAPDHGRQGAGRRRRADQRADHDQHRHRRRARHDRPDPRHRGSRRRHRARVLSRRGRDQGDEGDRRRRSNPGNIGSQQRVKDVVQAAKDHGCSMRIGVNAGSLEKELLEKYGEPCPEAMVESALNHAKILDDLDFREYKISVKASDAFLAVAAYQQLAEAVDCPIHLGITEAGGMISGTVKSSIGMGMLLWSGIGDTIRVSLSADPVEEVRVGFDILKSLNLRH